MVRHLQRTDSDIGFEGYHPGCMWGILNILDYHHWHNVKKMPLRRRHGRGKHAICCRNPKTVSFEHYTNGLEEYLDAEAVPLLDEQQATMLSPSNGISSKAHIKELIAREMSERTWGQRTGSIHHSEHCLGGISTDWGNPIIILHKDTDTAASGLQVPSVPDSAGQLVEPNSKDRPCHKENVEGIKQSRLSAEHTFSLSTSSNHNLAEAKHLNRGVSCPQFKECVDVLEIFKVNKNSFMEFLTDPDVHYEKNFHVQASNKRIKLRKSGSFPTAESSHIRYPRPSTLEDKQKEVWSFPKGEKFHTDDPAIESVASKFSEDSIKNSMVIKACRGHAISPEKNFSFHASSPGLNKHGWHLSFLSHFREFKKKIKHAIRESKKENDHTSADEKNTSESFKEMAIQQGGIEDHRSSEHTNASDNDPRDGVHSQERIASSLNDSMGRYSQLFDYNFRIEAKRHQYQSKSLKLSNEDKFLSNGYSLKCFRRRLSLPDLESFCHFPNEAPSDALYSKMPIKSVKDSDTDAEKDSSNGLKSLTIPVERKQFEPSDAVEVYELHENIVERGNSSENNECSCGLMVGIDEAHTKTGELNQVINELGNGESSPHLDAEIGSTMNSSRKCEDRSPVSVLETCFQDSTTGPAEFPVSGGPQFYPPDVCSHEPYSSVNLQDGSSRDTLGGCCGTENVENESLMIKNDVFRIESSENDADFNYVRAVLEISGFNEQENLATWYSLDQPLNPTLFKELEVYLRREPECSSEDVGYNCDHQLLFDLINEELLEIYESSLAYFPKPFSSMQRVRPPPKGSRVVEEVWKRIEWHRNSRSEMESLDDIVARDLAKGDGWMNLQMDVEDVALDLEDWLFEELLDEVIHS